jgi:hypothetical protein
MGSNDEDQAREQMLRLVMLRLMVACEDYVSDPGIMQALEAARRALEV